jgi:hypothetical protein
MSKICGQYDRIPLLCQLILLGGALLDILMIIIYI